MMKMYISAPLQFVRWWLLAGGELVVARPFWQKQSQNMAQKSASRLRFPQEVKKAQKKLGRNFSPVIFKNLEGKNFLPLFFTS
jgi:hypothetical protein